TRRAQLLISGRKIEETRLSNHRCLRCRAQALNHAQASNTMGFSRCPTIQISSRQPLPPVASCEIQPVNSGRPIGPLSVPLGIKVNGSERVLIFVGMKVEQSIIA